MSRLILALVLLLAGDEASALAQRVPPRDATGRLVSFRGRVLADNEAGTPLRRARVTVVTSDGSSDTVFTDGLGRFEARVPAAGDYTLIAGKSGFAPTVLTRAQLPAGAADIRLSQAAAVTGRVIDMAGQPVMSRSIRLRRVDGVQDAAQPAQLETETNDLGEYRFGNLAAGRYAVGPVQAGYPQTVFFAPSGGNPDAPPPVELARAADPPVSKDVVVDLRRGEESFVVHDVPDEQVVRLVFSASATGKDSVRETVITASQVTTRPPAGAVTGVILDEWGEPAEGVALELWQIKREFGRSVLGSSVATRRRTDDRGRYRVYGVAPGTYYVVAIDERTTQGEIEPMLLFYPGRAGVTDAVTVPIQAGQEVSGIDMVLDSVPSARVHGLALDATGSQPIVGSILLNIIIASEPVAMPSRSVPIGADGRFELLNVAPANYVLQAIGKGSADNREFGMQAVTVAGSDVGPLVISTMPGSTVRGTVTLEGAPPSLVTPPSKVGLSLAPAAPEYVPALSAFTGGFIDKDWTFEMVALTGAARFVLEGAPASWWLKSVTIDSINAADDPVMLGTSRQSREGVSVVIATNAASIQGRVRMPADQVPSINYSIAAFPVDSERWHYKSPYTKLARPGLDGSFGVSGLPPGEYWVVAVEGVLGDGPGADWQNPDLLKSLTSSARRVTLREGQRSTIELRPVSIPR